MKKILYTRQDGGVSIVIPVPKEQIEKVLGTMTNEEYEAHVRQRSVPQNVLNIRSIEDTDIPASREFRNAWCDVTELSSIDIDCTKARDIQLAKLRVERDKALAALDGPQMKALVANDTTTVTSLEQKKQTLRDATEPLNALNTTGKYNDSSLLQEIKDKGKMPTI